MKSTVGVSKDEVDEVSRDEFDVNSALGFPHLFNAMEKASGSPSKAVLDECAAIRQHVEIRNNSTTTHSPLPDAEGFRQCQRQLVVLLKQAQERAATTVKHAQERAAFHASQMEDGTPCFEEDGTPCFPEDGIQCTTSSEEAQAIADATIALFKLKHHGLECKEEFAKSGGIAASLKAMDKGFSQSLNPGMSTEATQSLALMLRLFLKDEPTNIESIIASDRALAMSCPPCFEEDSEIGNSDFEADSDIGNSDSFARQ